MSKTFKRVALDSETLRIINEHRERLKQVGLTDERLLSDNKVIKFINEKARRNHKLIPLEEILRILQSWITEGKDSKCFYHSY